jgi:hypothetical protein
MFELGSPRARRIVAALGLAIVFALSATGASPPGSAIAPFSGNPVHPLGASNGSATTGGIAMTPSSATVVAGTPVPFSVALLPVETGCNAVGVVFAWHLAGASALLGSLNATVGSSVVLSTYAYTNGTAEVEVTASVVAICGWFPEGFTETASANITIRAPLAVRSLTVDPDPAVAGAPVALNLTITSGQGPYAVTIAFGDGSSDTLTEGGAGPVSIIHRYAIGAYSPTAIVTDALGESFSIGAGQTVEVAAPLAIAIDAPGPEPDPGLPFPLTASVVGGVAPYSIEWNASVYGVHLGPAWTLDPLRPGPLRVSATVTDADGDVATAGLALTVAPPLNVSLRPARAAADLGEPLPVLLNLTGGTAPYSVNVTALPSGSHFSLTGVGANALTNALVPTSRGELWAQLVVVDADGAVFETVVPLAVVGPAPSLALNLTTPIVEAGSSVSFVALASGGQGPYNWTLESTGRPVSVTGGDLVDAASPLYAWDGTLDAAGPAIFLLEVEDAAGVETVRNLTLSVLPSLKFSVEPLANGSSSAPVPLAITVEGGEPPFALWIGLSNGEYRALNLSTSGTLEPTLPSPGPGAFRGTASVVDAAGGVRNATFWVNVSAPDPNTTVPHGPGLPPPSTDPALPPTGGGSGTLGSIEAGIGAAIGLALLAGLGWFLLRGRLRVRAAPGDALVNRDSLETVRRLVQENESIDRESLLLLAEDERISAAAVDAALARWESLGRLRTEDDPNGGTQYRWTAPTSSGSAVPPTEGVPAESP